MSRLAKPLALAFALQAACLGVAWIFPPFLNSDSATGFLVWDSWERTGEWNRILEPAHADLRLNASNFQSWWSPGQYVIVAPWQECGLSLGQAIAVGGFVVTVLGLWGYWRLFLSLGFDAGVAGWSVLALATNWTLTRTYGDYLGGEPALLGLLPWLVLAARRILTRRWAPWLLMPAVYWLGTMAKLSFSPMAAGLIAGFRGLQVWERPVFSWAKLREISCWIAWLALGHAVLWATYLRLGPNPASILHGPFDLGGAGQTLLQIARFPVSSAFSFGTLTSRIFLHPPHPLVGDPRQLWPVHLPVAAFGVALEIAVLKRNFSARPVYAWLLTGVLAAYTAFFGLYLFAPGAISWDDRYFKPVGFLLVPGIVDYVRTGVKRWRAWLVGIALAASSVYGVAAVANRARYIATLDNVGVRGITQHVASRSAIRVLHALDQALPAEAIVVVPSPEMALELRHVRSISTHAIMAAPAETAAQAYRGRTGDVVVLVNDTMLHTGQAGALLRCFADYAPGAWADHAVGEWHFFHQGVFSAWPAVNR